MAGQDVNRSRDRSVAVIFRTSPEVRTALRNRAAAAGLTLQAYIELTALGMEHPTSAQPGRPRKQRIDQELPLTG